MRRLISPFQMITDHCSPPLLRHTHTHAYTQIIYPTWQPATQQVCALTLGEKKGKHLISALSLLISSDTYISSACRQNTITEAREREGRALSVPGNETHSHPQWPFVTTVSAADNTPPYLSVSGAETLGQWEPVMNETSPRVWEIFLISRTNNTDVWNEYRRQKEHEQHELSWQAGGNRRFVRVEENTCWDSSHTGCHRVSVGSVLGSLYPRQRVVWLQF